MLTTSNDDVVNGTAANDLFNAPLGTLQTGDIILDNSTTDNDILNATTTSATAQPRISNIETVNITGEYVATGLNLGLSGGIQTLNLDTKIAGGTASVTGANSLNAASIVAGDNIKTLNVSSLASGTRDAVAVDANNATAVNLTGSGSPDVYSVELAADATLTLAEDGANAGTFVSAGDQVDVTVAGDATIVVDQGTGTTDNAELDLNIVANTADAVITLAEDGSVNAEKMILTGSKNITIEVTDGVALSDTQNGVGGAGSYDGTIITDNTTATTKILGTALVDGTDFRQAAVDIVEIEALAAAATVTINESSKLLLSEDLTAANDLTVELNNADENTAYDKGTLVVEVAETQTADLITTNRATAAVDGTVETILIEVKADEVTDTDKDENGSHESTISMANVTLGDTVTALVLNGSENLILEDVKTGTADQVITASNMTGNFTLSGLSVANDTTVVGGAGNDVIVTAAAAIMDVQSGAGNDHIDITSATSGTEVKAGTGNDTVVSNAATETAKIDLGAGDDTITTLGLDTITLGTGADTVKISNATLASSVVKDFVVGTDKLVLNGGTAGAAIDLSDLTDEIASGVYTIGGANAASNYVVKLQNAGSNLSTTDMRDSIQLVGATLFAGSANILGNLADSVTMTTGTVTLGGGSDSVTIDAAAVANASAIVKDFTVGEDKIVVTGGITVDLSVNLNNVTDTTGTYQIGDDILGASFKLENGGSNIVTENNLTSIVQLGSAPGTAFTVNANGADVSVTGGIFNDFVGLTVGANMATFNFSNNGGVDTVVTAALDGSKGVVNFNSLTGIDSTQGKVFKGKDAAKTADATDGAVYVFDDSADGAGTSKITTFQTDTANGYTQDVIDAEVAAFIEANLGTTTGETYVVIINDTSTAAYDALGTYTNLDAGQYNYESYIYLVNGNTSGVTADDVKLIGMLDDGNSNLGNLTFTSQANIDGLIA